MKTTMLYFIYLLSMSHASDVCQAGPSDSSSVTTSCTTSINSSGCLAYVVFCLMVVWLFLTYCLVL
ncbi:membrane protein UL147A [macacine betaherpesvirus 3]|nr:membrane protein UL147A [macacine betaherpesvirus 3]